MACAVRLTCTDVSYIFQDLCFMIYWGHYSKAIEPEWYFPDLFFENATNSSCHHSYICLRYTLWVSLVRWGRKLGVFSPHNLYLLCGKSPETWPCAYFLHEYFLWFYMWAVFHHHWSMRLIAIQVWDASSRRCLFTMSSHTQAISCVRWGGEGHIYSAARDCSINVWSAEVMTLIIIIIMIPVMIQDPTSTRLSSHFCAASRSLVYLYDSFAFFPLRMFVSWMAQ